MVKVSPDTDVVIPVEPRNCIVLSKLIAEVVDPSSAIVNVFVALT